MSINSINPLVTVYIPNYNYEKYLSKAIESVLDQSFDNWELILILDGAIDNSKKIVEKYQKKHPNKIQIVVNNKRKGLQYCANKALDLAKGKFFVRLDPDDYFNESALLVLSQVLINDSDVALVYPDYFYIDEKENILEIDNRKKVGKDVELLDLPAHGACTMLRVSALKSVGGYSEEFSAQDGHDIWYKIKDKYKISNVSTPLFYYRQHSLSLSSNNNRLLNERKKIKRKNIGDKYKDYKIAIVIGAKNSYAKIPNIALKEFKSKPLIDHTLELLDDYDYNGMAIISTDDDIVIDHCKKYKNFLSIKRPPELSNNSAIIENVVHHSIKYIEDNNIYFPDIVMFLNINNPMKKSYHIQKAIDTLLMNKSDSVISVYEDFDLHFQHKKYGLEAISKRRHKNLRLEREALFVDNRAINICWRNIIKENDFRGKSIGHIIMNREQSINIKSELDIKLIEQIYEKNIEELS